LVQYLDWGVPGVFGHSEDPSISVVSRGTTPSCTEERGLGHGHRAIGCPTPWSAYQSQHSHAT